MSSNTPTFDEGLRELFAKIDNIIGEKEGVSLDHYLKGFDYSTEAAIAAIKTLIKESRPDSMNKDVSGLVIGAKEFNLGLQPRPRRVEHRNGDRE